MVLSLIIIFIAVVSLGFNIKQRLTIETLLLDNSELTKEKLLAEALVENLKKELELEEIERNAEAAGSNNKGTQGHPHC